MFRLNTCVNADAFDFLLKFIIAQVIQHCTGDCACILAQDSQFSADCRCCVDVVTGYHNRSDSRFVTFFNRRLNFRSYRVDHALKADVAKVFFHSRRRNVAWHFVIGFEGCHENTQCLVCHLLVCTCDFSSVFFGDFTDFSALYNLGTLLKDFIRSTFGVLNDFSVGDSFVQS